MPMMGSRGWRGGQECDVLSMKARRMMSFGRGVIRKSKRSFWKRVRKNAKRDALLDAAGKSFET